MKQKGLNNFGAKGWWIIIFVGLLYLISSATVDLLNVTPQLFEAVKGWNQNSLLVFSGVGGWAPMPKKLKEDAVRMEDPMDILYCTMMSGIALGRIW